MSQGKRPYIYNFGDRLSPFLLNLLTGKHVTHSLSQGKLLALGSIFFALNDGDHVWGAGLLKPSHSYFASSRREVRYHAVRGPETRKVLRQNGIECPEIYGDPSLLLPLLIGNDITKTHSIGVVPHFSHLANFRQSLAGASCVLVDVEGNFDEVIRTILECEVILATSLHGLIIAEAYGIPALLLAVGNVERESLFKFEDYFHSTNRELVFEKIVGMTKLEQLADLARKQPRPQIDLRSLLEAFPLQKLTFPESDKPKITWGSLGGRELLAQPTSLRPPRFFIPSKLK